MTARAALATATLIVLAGCSSSAPPVSAVEQQAPSLVTVASPGPGWSRIQASLFGELIIGAVPAIVTIDGVPVALVEDRTGAVSYASSGWTRTLAGSETPAGCREAQSWMAKAEDRYGLVSGTPGFQDGCITYVQDAARDSLVGPTGLAAECAPAGPDGPSTCARVDAVVTAEGELQLAATVSVQS